MRDNNVEVEVEVEVEVKMLICSTKHLTIK